MPQGTAKEKKVGAAERWRHTGGREGALVEVCKEQEMCGWLLRGWLGLPSCALHPGPLWGPESGQLSCRQSGCRGRKVLSRCWLCSHGASPPLCPACAAGRITKKFTDLLAQDPIAPGELAAQPHPGPGIQSCLTHFSSPTASAARQCAHGYGPARTISPRPSRPWTKCTSATTPTATRTTAPKAVTKGRNTGEALLPPRRCPHSRPPPPAPPSPRPAAGRAAAPRPATLHCCCRCCRRRRRRLGPEAPGPGAHAPQRGRPLRPRPRPPP